jgi:hypothetical protein
MSEIQQFKFNIEQDPKEALDKTRDIAASNDIVMEGDEVKGYIDAGIVKASYEVSGKELRITVTDWPYLVDSDQLEKVLKDFFSGNDSRDYREIFGYMNLKRL